MTNKNGMKPYKMPSPDEITLFGWSLGADNDDEESIEDIEEMEREEEEEEGSKRRKGIGRIL